MLLVQKFGCDRARRCRVILFLGASAEYESEAEERVRWLFIEMWKLVWSCS